MILGVRPALQHPSNIHFIVYPLMVTVRPLPFHPVYLPHLLCFCLHSNMNLPPFAALLFTFLICLSFVLKSVGKRKSIQLPLSLVTAHPSLSINLFPPPPLSLLTRHFFIITSISSQITANFPWNSCYCCHTVLLCCLCVSEEGGWYACVVVC